MEDIMVFQAWKVLKFDNFSTVSVSPVAKKPQTKIYSFQIQNMNIWYWWDQVSQGTFGMWLICRNKEKNLKLNEFSRIKDLS